MSKYNVCVYDTRESEETHIANIPAENLEQACRKVTTRYGWRLVIYRPTIIGSEELDDPTYYAINPEYFETKEERFPNPEAAIQELAKEVESGELDEARGLYQLYEDDQVIEWEE